MAFFSIKLGFAGAAGSDGGNLLNPRRSASTISSSSVSSLIGLQFHFLLDLSVLNKYSVSVQLTTRNACIK